MRQTHSHKHPSLDDLRLGNSTLKEKLGGFLFFCALTSNVTETRATCISDYAKLARGAVNHWKELTGRIAPESESDAALAYLDLKPRNTSIVSEIMRATKAFRREALEILTAKSEGGTIEWKDPLIANYLQLNKFWRGFDRFEFMLLQYAAGNQSIGPSQLGNWVAGLEIELSKIETVSAGINKRLKR
jgi:hypothetical protein